MKRKIWILGILSLLVLQNSFSEEKYWRIEAESEQVLRNKAVKIVEDIKASGGKAIEIPVIEGWNIVIVSFPKEAEPGKYRISLRIKLENSADIGKALRVDIRDSKSNKLLEYGVAYGLYFKEKQDYKDFSIYCDWFNSTQRPVLYLRWTTGEGSPNLHLDAFDFTKIGEVPNVRIKSVFPDKIRYLSKEDGTIRIVVESLSKQVQKCKIKLELFHDLDEPELISIQDFSLEPSQTTELKFPFKNKGKLFGYAARATLILEDKEVEQSEEYFTVHDNPFAVATGARDEELGDYYTPWGWIYYGIGSSDKMIEEASNNARREYTTCAEFFSWSPGEAFYLTPKEEFWIRGNGGNLLRSKRELQKAVSALKRHGIGCITYVAQQAMGEHTIELLRQKPEWFSYSSTTGDVLEFYVVEQLEKRKEFWNKFDWDKYKTEGNPLSPDWKDTPEAWKKYTEFWKKPSEECRKLSTIGYFVPNYKLSEVIDYCADQIVASSKMFGWDGLRWDCGHLNTGPVWGQYSPYVDFYGNPLADTPEEMEKQTINNLKRLKARIREEFPNFVFGTNYGSWGETHTYPEMTKELCRDGGWLLDEMSYQYNHPTSPYHYWDKYYAIMADQGEYITSLGGHYHPFAFNRTGGKYPVDRLYETIFRIAGKGHPFATYYNSRTPAGNFAQFCVRFGRFLFDTNLRRLDKPQEVVNVTSNKTLWWKKTVQQLKQDDKEFLVVHLINPPVVKEVETDPLSQLNPPVKNVIVSAKLPKGKSKPTVWLLTAESLNLNELPKTQAVLLPPKIKKGSVTVTVPEILYWKTVVFKFER